MQSEFQNKAVLPKITHEVHFITSLDIFSVAGARIVQSVWRLATGWTTERSEFKSRYGQEFSLLHIIQTSSGAHPASYPMGTGGSFQRGKVAEAGS
jgi:hypothetical protein